MPAFGANHNSMDLFPSGRESNTESNTIVSVEPGMIVTSGLAGSGACMTWYSVAVCEATISPSTTSSNTTGSTGRSPILLAINWASITSVRVSLVNRARHPLGMLATTGRGIASVWARAQAGRRLRRTPVAVRSMSAMPVHSIGDSGAVMSIVRIAQSLP